MIIITIIIRAIIINMMATITTIMNMTFKIMIKIMTMTEVLIMITIIIITMIIIQTKMIIIKTIISTNLSGMFIRIINKINNN